jgi:nitrogen regulatory protein PII
VIPSQVLRGQRVWFGAEGGPAQDYDEPVATAGAPWSEVLLIIGGADVKMIRCSVQQFQIDELLDALQGHEIWNLTVTNGWERPRLHAPETFVFRGCRYKPRLLPTMVIDITVPDYVVDDIIRVVSDKCKTGPKPDERPVLVIPVEDWRTVRTRERQIA